MKTNLPDFSELKFLIVDDEPFMLSMIERMLRQCNAGLILKASDGVQAAGILSGDIAKIDCVISDCNMKPMNGLQLLQAIRSGVDPKIARNQPFILLTGHGERNLVQTAIQLDVNGYVVKPVAMDTLVHAITRAVGVSKPPKGSPIYRDIQIPKVQTAVA